MINFQNADSFLTPFPYMVLDNCFDQDIFNKLNSEFPDNSDSKLVMGGRRQMNISNSKTVFPDYEKWIKSAPTWKEFFNWINSDIIFHNILSYYNTELEKFGCRLNRNSSLQTDCYTHIDWSTAEDGYVREIHTDSTKRIWNYLIFFNDKDWEGGDFIIHSPNNSIEKQQQYFNNELPIYKVIEAKANRALFFLSTPDSYHSVSLQSNTKTPRKFIYGSYSYKYGDVFKSNFPL